MNPSNVKVLGAITSHAAFSGKQLTATATIQNNYTSSFTGTIGNSANPSPSPSPVGGLSANAQPANQTTAEVNSFLLIEEYLKNLSFQKLSYSKLFTNVVTFTVFMGVYRFNLHACQQLGSATTLHLDHCSSLSNGPSLPEQALSPSLFRHF